MEISSITGLNIEALMADKLESSTMKPGVSFDNYLTDEINNVNNNIIKADESLADFAAGKTSNIHEVLLSIEEAKLSFQMILQVRNKVVESMQEVLRMQV